MSYKFNPFTGNLDEAGSGAGGGTPGGSDTQIQFNDAGSFGGDVDLTWNKTTNVMTVAGDVNLSDGGTYTTTLQTITPTANRTVSIPDATGTVALVAGSSGQPIYNNAGAYAGLSTATIGTTGNITLSLNGAAGVSPVALTGTWFAGTTPQVLIQPSTATAGAWSASGTGLGVNATSGFAGNLLDLQVNGSRQFSVAGSGTVSVGTVAGTSGNIKLANNIQFGTSGAGAIIANAGYSIVRLGNSDNDGNFNRLEFGTNTSSAPALKRSGAILQARLADDSAYTTIDAQHRLQGTAPATASSTGTTGDIRYDADYIYVCTATNTWKRAALATW